MIEDKLKLLYALQRVDTELQEVNELKGDLPSIVAELEGKVAEMKAKIKELQASVKQAKIARDSADGEIVGLASKIERYKGQQLQVKSNEQYDALTREIEMAQQRSSRFETEMDDLETKMVTAKTEADGLAAPLEELTAELSEKQKELREINKAHEKEELKLQHERTKILAKVDKADFDRYERIRKAKGGKAVVPVKRGACGGCFSRIPPQKILEIRLNEKYFACEHCGRMLVSDQIVEMSMSLT
jgi:predicted  nucleic acid-binding Zn-ribbon protein